MMKPMIKQLLAGLCAAALLDAAAAITVQDDDGRPVTLSKPAQRVIALSPHVTEMLFAAGAGARIVGTVTHSDYPEAAKRIAQVGSNRQIDMERVVALKPDLIVAWMHGSSERQVEQIRALGIPLFHSEPRKLDDIAANLTRLGKLLGTETAANAAAADLRARLAKLTATYAGRAPVRLFYQVWDKPLYTLSAGHIVNDAMRVCGGENIFAGMKVTAPVVNVESVLQLDPEVILDTAARDTDRGLDLWKPYPMLTAVRRENLFRLDGDLLNRAGPRMVQGTAVLCEKLELARKRRTP